MGRILFDVLEINIVAAMVILPLCLFAEKLRGRYGARWLKLVWIVLTIRLLIPYNFSLPFTEIRLFNVPGFAQEEQREVEKVVEAESTTEVVSNTVVQTEGTANMQVQDAASIHTVGSAENTTTDEMTNKTLGIKSDVPIGNYAENTEAVGEEIDKEVTVNYVTYTNILVLIWLLGVVGFGLYYIVVYAIFQRKSQKCMHRLEEGALAEQIYTWQEEYLGKVKLEIYQSDTRISPMLSGLLKTKLVLPANVEEWHQEELRMVVLHELCHYQQKDLWLKIMVLLAHCLNWFNPALIWMKKQCFYDIELVCDMTVLEGCGYEEREWYARTILHVARKEKEPTAFSAGFADSKKNLKNRIAHMFDESSKKRGLGAFVLVTVLLVGMSLLISCGYKPEELSNANTQGDLQDAYEQETDLNDKQEPKVEFDYNNAYNRMICLYNGITYLGKENGIYQVTKEGEIRLFENDYGLMRDLELYQDKLYFCGTVMRGDQLQNTIYYMDLNSMEVKDVLELFSNNFSSLYYPTIYEDKLYVLADSSMRIGFELDEYGMATKQLDSQAEDYIYKDYNTYLSLQEERWNTGYDSSEWEELTKKMSDMYVPVIDVAACQKILNGRYVVSKYKDEMYRSLYLVDENGEYEYICDTTYTAAVLVTEDGIYCTKTECRDFMYVDFETKQQQDIYEMLDAGEVFLVNYDAEYVYFGKSVYIDNGNTKESLMRIPRTGGTAEEVYAFEEDFSTNSLCMYSAIDEKYMYFMSHERILLDLEKSNVGTESVIAPTKEEVLAMREKALAGMTDEEIKRLKENIKVANQQMEEAYMYEDLFGKLSDPEHLYWNYFDQKADIQIGWESDGTATMVYNRFDADNFVNLMEEMRDSLKADLLKQDFDNLIEYTKLAKETHNVEYAEQIYRILHDMDYFLLRYGIEDVGKYLRDFSTVEKYYGVLEVYGGNSAPDNAADIPDNSADSTVKIVAQVISREEVAVSPAIVEYTLDEALEIGQVLKFQGELAGTGLGTLYIITIDGVEHFYEQYDFYGYDMKDYNGYAIFSEDYELGCGIKVGMSREEVLAKYPYMRMEDFEGNCLSDSLAPEYVLWNGGAYPSSALGTDPDFAYNGKDYNWLDQFDYVMIADIDLGTDDTLPVCLGLLMKEEKVGAITFYYPTAG